MAKKQKARGKAKGGGRYTKGAALTLAALGAGSGCAHGTLTPKPGQSDAEEAVWSFYGDRGNFPEPTIYWMQDADLDCDYCKKEITDPAQKEYCAGFKNWGRYGECVDGAHFDDGNAIMLAWKKPYRHLFETEMAHELYHAHLLNTTGDADACHKDPGWQANSVVDQALNIMASIEKK